MKDTLNKGLEAVSNAGQEAINNIGDQISDSIVDQTGSKPTTTLQVNGATSDLSVTAEYLITQENQIGWISLYVVTIVIAVLGNLLFIVG